MKRADGTDAWPLVPIPPSGDTEPAAAVVARAKWSSILAGLLTEVAAYYVVSEALTNTAKHARASHARVGSSGATGSCGCR